MSNPILRFPDGDFVEAKTERQIGERELAGYRQDLLDEIAEQSRAGRPAPPWAIAILWFVVGFGLGAALIALCC